MNKCQKMLLFDYCKLFRFYAEKVLSEARNNPKLCPELRLTIETEQNRRIKELSRLERALGAEIEAFTEGSEIICPEPTASPKPRTTGQKAKHKSNATGKKSKKRGDGTTGTSSSAKNANASSTKRKPGRPRKTTQTE